MQATGIAFRRAVLSAALLGAIGGSAADITPLGPKNQVQRMNGAGDLFVGSYTQDTTVAATEAYLWGNGAATGLGTLPGFDTSSAYGLAEDGSVVIGDNYAFGSSTNQAFVWTPADGMVALPELNAGESTYARSLSADGGIIVGQSGNTAVYWTGTGTTRTVNDLTAGITGLAAPSIANGVSADGSTIVGSARWTDSPDKEAYRWTSATGMTRLGLLPGSYATDAYAVSADGSVVMGSVYMGTGPQDTTALRTFRWTATGGMTDIGVLPGMVSTTAFGMSADGSIIVGYSADYSQPGINTAAFYWTAADGMQSLSDWLAANGVAVGGNLLLGAYDVSDDGNIVLGFGIINGTSQGFIARIDNSTTNWPGDTSGSSGIIGTSDYGRSVANAGTAVALAPTTISGMTLNGAHHRLLVDNGLTARNCAWITGDFGRYSGAGARNGIAEAGVCGDLGTFRVGVGLGLSRIRQDLALGGDLSYDGRQLVVEIDRPLAAPGMVASLTGFYGTWDADIERRYLNGAIIDRSVGTTSARAWALRARLDYYNMATVGRFGLSSFASYTHTRSRIDGYTETGGGFPATFGDFDARQHEFRAGLTGDTALSPATTLMTRVEAIHTRTDHGNLTGTVAGVGALAPQTLGSSSRTQARLGIEVDHRLRKDLLFNASAHFAAGGGDNALTLSLGLRQGF